MRIKHVSIDPCIQESTCPLYHSSVSDLSMSEQFNETYHVKDLNRDEPVVLISPFLTSIVFLKYDSQTPVRL